MAGRFIYIIGKNPQTNSSPEARSRLSMTRLLVKMSAMLSCGLSVERESTNLEKETIL